MTIVAFLETPAAQWTKTEPNLKFSSINLKVSSKYFDI